MIDTSLYNEEVEHKKNIKIDNFLADIIISNDLLHETVIAYLNNQRTGQHKTKTRGEVAFSGAKPWKQKGTGHARAGQRNSPLWRKGGTIFGPKPKNYYTKISKRKKRLSLLMSICQQIKAGHVIILESIKINKMKTKIAIDFLNNLGINLLKNKVLLITFSCNNEFKFAFRNIKNVGLMSVKNLNSYNVLLPDFLVFTTKAINYIKNLQNKNSDVSINLNVNKKMEIK